jgi:ribose transport system substrate-binding protein
MRRFRWFLSAVLLVSLALTGCSSNAPTHSSGGQQNAATGGSAQDGSAKREIKVALISKGFQHEFWQTVKLGADSAAKELGVEATFVGPTDETKIADQVAMVEDAINKKVSVIALAALDKKALQPVVEKAKAANIPVITFDSGVEGDIPLSFIATDNVAAGAIAGEQMAKLIGETGKVAIVAHNAGTQTAIDREKGFRDAIAKYPNIQVLNTQYSDGDKAKALAIAQDLMTANPDLAGIYGTNEGAAVGVARAVQEKGMAGKIAVIGFDSSADEIAFIESGVMQGIVVQNPFQMGYLSVKTAVDIVGGKTVEKRIDTGATFINKENLQSEEAQKLLYPLGKK